MASQDCQVCLERFDNAERRPRCLSCGHTLCTCCLTDIIIQGPLQCPFCRLLHNSPATSAEEVPINFTVVSLLEDPAFSIATQRDQVLLTEVKKEANEFTTEQLITFNCHLTRLHDFQQRLKKQQVVQQNHLQALQAIVGRHESLLYDMTSTSNAVSAIVAEGEEKRATIQATQARVNAASSLLEVTSVHQDNPSRNGMVRDWSAKAQQLLQCQAIHAARELELVTCTALDAAVERNTAGAAAALIPQKGQVEDFPNVPMYLSNMIKAAAMVASDVWAVHDENGRPRCAKITHVDGRLMLHSLHEGTPPVFTHKVPYHDVRNMVDETCMRTFLELSWGGQIQGRVQIKLSNMASRTRQFFYLCSGERGPSYANTRLLEVENRGRPGEHIWGGDYERNNGSGGLSLPGLTMGDLNSQSVAAGLVASFCYGDDHKPSHFTIYNNDNPIAYEECPIGQVECGIELTRAAARLPNIQDVTVSNCGLVISLNC